MNVLDVLDALEARWNDGTLTPRDHQRLVALSATVTR